MYVKLSKVVNTERTLRFHSFSTYAKFSEKLTFLPPEMHTCVSSNWYHVSYYLLTGALSILKIGNYWQTGELDDEKLRWRRKQTIFFNWARWVYFTTLLFWHGLNTFLNFNWATHLWSQKRTWVFKNFLECFFSNLDDLSFLVNGWVNAQC